MTGKSPLTASLNELVTGRATGLGRIPRRDGFWLLA
jgi:hypothetical protein